MMIRARRAALVVAAVGVVAVACSSFSADSVTGDAGTDASSQDAQSSPDAALPFCGLDAGAAFCDDFDDPRRTPWVSQSVWDGGAIEITDAAFFSPPSSLHVTLTVPPDAGGNVFRVAEILRSMAGFHAELKVFPEKLDPVEVNVGVTIFTQAPGDGGTCGFFAKSNDTETTLYEQSPPGATYTPTRLGYRLVAGRWNAVAIDLDGPAGRQTVTVTIDGMTAGSFPVVATCQGSPRFDSIWAGLVAVQSNFPDPLEAWIDDVRLDLR
jgi:hypothetical protein